MLADIKGCNVSEEHAGWTDLPDQTSTDESPFNFLPKASDDASERNQLVQKATFL